MKARPEYDLIELYLHVVGNLHLKSDPIQTTLQEWIK